MAKLLTSRIGQNKFILVLLCFEIIYHIVLQVVLTVSFLDNSTRDYLQSSWLPSLGQYLSVPYSG